MSDNIRINYVELPAKDPASAWRFYESTFGWKFESYGPDYCAFNDGALDGGFFRSDLASSTANGAALVVLYAPDLEAVVARVVENGGTILKPTFAFPGGRRFHFADPNGNELAVWSE